MSTKYPLLMSLSPAPVTSSTELGPETLNFEFAPLTAFRGIGKLVVAFPRRGGRAWLNAHDSKSCIPQGIGGSNPSLSASCGRNSMAE